MWGMPVFLFLYPLLLSVVDGEGSKNIWPTSAPACGALDAGSCRANLEWRNDSYGFGVGQMYRRTLFYVFLNAGEYLLMGSTAQGLNASNIEVFLPGTVTGKPGNETLPPTAALSCSTQLPTNGVITTRTQELAGPQAPVGGGNPTGYPPCVYLALVTGIHNVAMYGPLGRLPDPANGLVGADIALTNALNFNDSQKTTMAGWDLTVRADLTTTTNIEGRAFTYALSMITANNSMPVFLSFYAIVPDGYVYRVDTRGMDPNGWVMYGNKVGFYDSDMQTPLYHDIRGRNGQLTLVTGDVGIAPPEFPLFFNPPNSATLTALNYPLTPIPPVLGSIKFHGSVTANAGGLGVGGTFEVTSSGNATYAIVISRDGIDFDPTNPLNRVLRGFVSGTVANVTWGGKDNFGNAFPVGGPYYVSGTVHGGEYHFPMLDVESSALGGPTITLTNAACPPLNGGCHAAFYDDRGYQPMTGVPVGNATNLCPGFDYGPTILFSHPTLGFDSSSSQRAFGVKTFASNFNTDCRAGSPVFGDAKGLDLWTYTPSANKSTPLWVVQRAITGHVWLDVNNDGIESGAGETPFANVNVTVSNGTTSITVKTDEFGNYYADVGASAQNWIVTVAIPPGYYLTTFNNPQTVSTAVGTLFNATKVGLSASSFAPTNAPTAVPTTQSPVTLSPVTASPTSLAPTTNSPTFSPTKNPTTVSPTTKNPTTLAPTTESPTTLAPTTNHPTTQSPTTKVPTTENPTTVGPTTGSPTHNPTTKNPTTQFPTTQNPVTANPTTNPTTVNPTTNNPTTSTPTQNPTTQNPTTKVPTTGNPTKSPTTQIPTTVSPTTQIPTTQNPTHNPTTQNPTTQNPTTESPTTQNPTTQNPTQNPTTQNPTTQNPTTQNPTTESPTTVSPTTQNPTTQNPTTESPTTQNPTTQNPTTQNPTTQNPTTQNPTTQNPTTSSPTHNPTTQNPTTQNPTTESPTTQNPTTQNPTTVNPTTQNPTQNPTTQNPTTQNPTTQNPTTQNPTTESPTTQNPTTLSPATQNPTTQNPTTQHPTTQNPTTQNPTTQNPTTSSPTHNPTTQNPTTQNPTTQNPTTQNPTTQNPTTQNPTTESPTTQNPTTQNPTTQNPTTESPTTQNPTTQNPTTVNPTTQGPTQNPTTQNPTTQNPTTQNPTTQNPTTQSPTTLNPTTQNPTTSSPTHSPTTQNPTTQNPTTQNPTTQNPTTQNPTTQNPTTQNPTTQSPTTQNPTTQNPTTQNPTTVSPTTQNPTTQNPTTQNPTQNPTTQNPTTQNPTTQNPTTQNPTTQNPTTQNPTTQNPTTQNPTTQNPTTVSPTTQNPTTQNPTQNPTTQNPTTQNPTTQNPTTQNPTTQSPTTVSPTTSSPTPCATNVTGFTGIFASSAWQVQKEPGSTATTTFTATTLTMVTNNGGQPDPTRSNASIVVSTITDIYFTWSYSTPDRATKDEPRYAVNGIELGVFPGFIEHDTNQSQQGSFHVELLPGDRLTISAYSYDNIRTPATFVIGNFTAINRVCSNAPTTGVPTVSPTSSSPTPCDLVVTGFTGFFAPSQWTREIEVGSSASTVYFTNEGLQVMTNNIPGTVPTAETRYNYSIFNNKPMTISFSWNYTSFDRASKDEPKHFADGVEYLDTGFLNSDDTVGFQSGAVAGVNVGANQAFKFIAYSFDNIRGPATITIFNFHAVVHSCSVAPTTRTPTTQTPTTLAPGTKVPTTLMPTPGPTPPTTLQPVTKFPTKKPTTRQPTTRVPTTHAPTAKPTVPAPVTELPTPAPSVMILPTTQPTPKQPTVSPTACARTVSGFQGLFDPSLWTLTNDPNSNGFVSFFTVDQLQMWSNDAGPSQRKRLIEGITVPMTTIVTFQWEYSTPDRPTFDVPVYSINGAETRFPGFDASTIGPTHQSGVVGPLTLQAGQTFKIIFDSIDGIFGSARLDIFGWQAYINTCISPTAPSTMTLPPSSPTQAAPTSAVSPTTPPTSPTIPPTSPTAKAPTACDRTVGGFQSLFAPELWTMTNDAGSNAYVGMFTVNQLQMWSDNAGPSNSKRLAEGITITAPSTVSFQWTYQTPDRPTFDIPFYSINGVDTMFPGFNTSWTGAQAQSGVVGPLTLQPGQTFKIIFDSLDGIFGAAELNIFGWQARINTCGTPTTPTAPTAPTSPTSPTQKSPTMPPTATSPTACDRTVGGFQGLFAPPLWTMTNDAGSSAYVALFTVNQLQMWSDNAGPSDSRRLAEGITITAPSIVSFQWTYQTPDRPTFDIPYYSINGIDTMFTGFNTSWTGPQSQSGVVGPLTLQPGQYFKIIFDSLDGIFGAAELDIFGWQARINTCGTPTTPTAPTATSPTAASPTASGPTASAPTASGPTASGPTAQQPSVVAPTSKPTSSPTVFVFRVVTIPPTTAVVSQVYLYPFGTSLGPNQEVVAVTGLPSWLSLQPDNVIAGVPPSSAVGGSYPIVISASDGNGNTIMQNFTLTVINPQIPPQITSVPPLTATPGTPYIYPISTTGSPSPSVMVITDAPWLVFNPYTNTLEGIPPAGSGPVTVSIAVSNGNSPNAYQSFVVQVGAAPTNAPSSKPSVAGTTLTPTSAPTLATSPTITSTPPSNALVNQQFCYQIVATGSPQPTLSVNSLPTWMTFRDGEICGIPPVGTSGNVIITVVASNGNPPDATQLVVIHVGTQAPTQGVTAAPTAAPTIGSSCPPPHITSFPPLTTTSTANPYVYTITADSPVSLSLDSSVITPGWLQIVGNQLKGTPPPGTSGNALAKIRATNACGAYDVQLVSIAITNPAPQLQSLSCNTVEGSAFLIPISATGTPQPQLALFGAPSWMNLVNNSIRGTPPAGSAGTQYTIQVLATNGYAPNALVSCSGWVQGPTDFTVTGNPPTTVLVGSTYTYAPVITTSSSGDPTLLLQVAPPWLNVQGTQLVGVPPQGGSYPVVLLICDSTGRQCVEKSFTITAQQPVTLGGPFNQTVGVGAQYKFTVPVSGGYPAPVLQLSNAPSWLTINGTTVSGTPPSGTTAFTYTVIGANGVNPTAFATYNVTVGGGMSCSQGLDELTQEAAKLANYSTDDQLPLCALASTGLVTLAASNNLTSCQKACFQPQATVTTITLGGGSGRRLLTLANITAAEDEIARQWGLSLSPRKVYIVGQDPLRVVTLVPPGSVTGPLAFVNGQAVVSANQTSASQKDLLDLLASLQKGTRAGTGSSTTSATVETTPAYAYVLAGLLFVTVLLCLYFMVHFFGQRRKKEASDRG